MTGFSAHVESVMDSMATYESDRDKKGQDKCAKETITSSTADLEDAQDEKDVPSKILPCQLPPKELNPRSFTLPCTIGSLNFYAIADLGASVNVIPKSMFEILKLSHLKKTNMLVEMADMTKKVPMGIVENVLVKIDKFLFPSDFVVIYMLEAHNETMILGRPFLATIHAEINVFNKEISLGIGEDKITFNMNKKIHNFTTPVEKVHVINSIQDDEPCNSGIINQNNNTMENNDMQERCSKKARIDEAYPIMLNRTAMKHLKYGQLETPPRSCAIREKKSIELMRKES
ncbi:putative ribonuclease H-like domain-containing protein [Tanacetum coccineum]